MKLSLSNIGWYESDNAKVLEYVANKGYSGLEIAPTVYISENPYDNIDQMQEIAKDLKEKYNLEISSMQSIWFGQTGNIFNSEEAQQLLDYTKKAIDFASAINCKNLVFGCPKNRVIPEGKTNDEIIWFFKELGDYAKEKKTVLSLEPNPVIYNTNFMNTTKEAIEFVKLVNSDGFKVNIDFGTIIENGEDLKNIIDNLQLVNHIHISEPFLEKVIKRDEHIELAKYLRENNYDKYISIEMKKKETPEDLIDVIDYVYEIFS